MVVTLKVENYKNLMVLILLIFVGQVVSAPITTCKTNDHTQSMTFVESALTVMDDMQISLDQFDNMNMECCEDDCHCPLGMCISVVLYTSDSMEVLFSKTSSQIIPEIPFTNNYSNSSIYRPPIFC